MARRKPWPGLTLQSQRDWSGGSVLSTAREAIPGHAFAKATNALLDQEGTVYKRGGSAYQSNADFAAALTFLWDGFLQTQKTVFASATAFGTFAGDGVTPVSVGGGGTDGRRPAIGNAVLFVPSGGSGAAGQVVAYGGSAKASVSTGTITTNGSTTVTGAGTSWSAGTVDAGMILTSGSQVLGVVESVVSTTQLTLRAAVRDPQVATAAYVLNQTYTFSPLGSVPIDAVATISNPARLVVASGSKVWFSGAGTPFTFNTNATSGDFHTLPQGAQVLGMEALRNVLFVFTTQGVFTITGMDFNLIDSLGNVQHRLEQLSRDIVLWDARGIAGWSGALIVPGIESVMLLTDTAAPRVLSEPIRNQYQAYVRAGFQCGGGAVFANHYVLPIVNGATWVDTLVCKLDTGAWTFWSGHGGTSTWFTARSAGSGARAPKLLSAGGLRVLDMTGAFTPAASNKNDANGTTHRFELVTRDYPTGNLNRNLVKKIRLRYNMTDAASDAPTMQAFTSSGIVTTGNPIWGATVWGAFQWGASTIEQFVQLNLPVPNAPAQTMSNPVVWQGIPTESGLRPRFVRFKFSSSSPCARLDIRTLELFTRSGGRQ